MSTSRPTGADPKHAWAEIPGRDLPKRATEQRLADFHEAHFPFDEATAREQASRCIQCPRPGCVMSCPVGSPIHRWLELTAEGRFLDASRVVADATPIADICARLCPRDHLCESACVVGGPSEPVSIGAVEEFLAEYGIARGDGVMKGPANGWRVAVLGTGVAGLACAEELLRRGFEVTMYDGAARPGGFLLSGTSTLRLDEAIVERRIAMLRDAGVRFQMGVLPGRDVSLERLSADYDAIFVGWDARRARELLVPGGRLPGVVQGTEFVGHEKGEALAGIPGVDVQGSRVVVIGEDNTAIDCVRVALRRGAAEAVCVCPHAAETLACCRREFDDAVEEGARFRFEEVPVSVTADESGRANALVVAGARRTEGGGSEPISGTERILGADWIILALGVEAEPHVFQGDFGAIAVGERGSVVVDAGQMTSVPMVFAGGDVVRGPCEVVVAVRDARAAAEGIEVRLKERRSAGG